MTAQPKTTWPPEKFERWYREQAVKPHRDYRQTIVPRIQALASRDGFKVETYGQATYTLRILNSAKLIRLPMTCTR